MSNLPIVYINLDHRADRRAAMAVELAQLGWTAERFAAIPQPLGALGCAMSHAAVIQLAKTRNWPAVMVLEDDFQCTDPAQLNAIVRAAIGGSDVLLLGGNVRASQPVPGRTDVQRVTRSYTSTGYVVLARYYDVLLATFAQSAALLSRGVPPQYAALDVLWFALQERDAWWIVAPPIVVQRPGFSDIEQKVVDYRACMMRS